MREALPEKEVQNQTNVKKDGWRTILLATLIVGTLDILAAMIRTYSRGGDPIIVLKYIASAVHGPAAFSGGTGIAATGLLFHYIVAFGWTLLFFILYPVLKLQTWNRIVLAVVYGILIWAVMSNVVLPLTKAPRSGAFNWREAAIAAGILVLAIGFPLSLIGYNHFKKKRSL